LLRTGRQVAQSCRFGQTGLAYDNDARHARRNAPLGVMPMTTNVFSCPKAGKIGPIRREIIFEPLPDEAVPAEPPPGPPDQPVPEQVPAPR